LFFIDRTPADTKGDTEGILILLYPHQRRRSRKENEMKTVLYPILLAAVIAGTAHANADSNNYRHDKHRSRTLVLESPSQLPELAQKGGEALYLHSTSDGRMFLYIEGIGGKSFQSLM
jgi:hypothetical protein